MQATIVAIKRTPRTSKTGKPFVSVGIKTVEHGEKWLSGFSNSDNAEWKEGSIVEIEVETKGDYLNFKTPKRDQGPAANDPASAELKNVLMFKILPLLEQNNAGIQKLELLIKALGDRIDYLTKKGAGEINPDEPEDEVPF